MMKIENEYIITADGLRVIEIFDDTGRFPTYDYYVYCPGFSLEHSFGILAENGDRFGLEDLKNLYCNGYFDGLDTFDEWKAERRKTEVL